MIWYMRNRRDRNIRPVFFADVGGQRDLDAASHPDLSVGDKPAKLGMEWKQRQVTSH